MLRFLTSHHIQGMITALVVCQRSLHRHAEMAIRPSSLLFIWQSNVARLIRPKKPPLQEHVTCMSSSSNQKPSRRPAYPVGKNSSLTQVYVPNVKFQHVASGAQIQISREELNHLRARRLSDGSSIVLFNADGQSVSAKLQGKYAIVDSIFVDEDGFESSKETSSRNIHAIVAAVKSSSRSDWLVEKLTELGVSTISIAHTKRCSLPANVIQDRTARWTRVAVAAAKQSLRTNVPAVNTVLWSEAISLVKSTTPSFLLSSGGESLLNEEIASSIQKHNQALFFIGPEGGLTPSEEGQILVAGAAPIGLGSARLRTETAAVVTSAIIGQILDLSDTEEDKSQISPYSSTE